MRSFWKGTISFGLVSIPVRLYSAMQSLDPKFHYLHEPCMAPIQYRKVCSSCGEEVTGDEIVLGVEVAGGYVPVSREELRDLPQQEKRSISVLQFVREGEVDAIYLDQHYFLEPQAGGERSYSLLQRAMREEQVGAVCRLQLRTKPSLALLRPFAARALLLETMHDPDEVRSTDPLTLPDADTSEREEALARQLIQALLAPFVPEEHEDAYRQALISLINARVPVRPTGEERHEAPADLLEALKASLAANDDTGGRDLVRTDAGR